MSGLPADEYDRMISKGAFDGIDRRIELIRGELREMSPAGPVHEDYIDFLNRWSTQVTTSSDCVVRVQSSIDLVHSRPEPDVTWLKPKRYHTRRPQASDVLLLIEVADLSVEDDLVEKAELYAESGIAEYWVVDVKSRLVQVLKLPTNGQYTERQVKSSSEKLSPDCKPLAVLELAKLFVT